MSGMTEGVHDFRYLVLRAPDGSEIETGLAVNCSPDFMSRIEETSGELRAVGDQQFGASLRRVIHAAVVDHTAAHASVPG